MSITAYKLIVGTAANLNDEVSAGLNTWQPFGTPLVGRDGYLVQPLIQGAPSEGVPPGSVALTNGDTVAVVNSAGADSHNATATVTTGVLTNVKLAATMAMVDNADTVVVKNSAGTTVTGTHAAEVAVGALTDVKLAATVAPVLNGQALTGVTPTGTYATTVTFTVAAGVITAIVLS